MANGRNKTRGAGSGRDPGGFVALPWTVLDCAAYASLSHPARSLLLEIARQYVKDNNGRLLASSAHMAKRGWKSRDVLTRAKRELIDARLIHETVMGHRPNKASWYAITWQSLDKLSGYDVGASESFRRGAYMDGTPLKPKMTREQMFEKWDGAGKAPIKNASLSPSHGLGRAPIGPSHGLGAISNGPSHGPIRPALSMPSSPLDGHPLEMPSIGGNEDSLVTSTTSAPDRMATARKAEQEAMGKHPGQRSPHRHTKVAQAIKTASEGFYRVQDADPLPEGWQ